MEVTSHILAFLHDARLLGVHVDFSSEIRSFAFTATYHDDCGDDPVAGKTVIVRAEDITLLQSRVYGAVTGYETIDSCDLSVSDATAAVIREWLQMGVGDPKARLSLTTHSGSIWEIMCGSLSIKLQENRPTNGCTELGGSASGADRTSVAPGRWSWSFDPDRMSFLLDQLLIFAVRAGNRPLAQERLARGANPNYLDSQHGSAAMEAVRRGDADMLSLLLDAGLTSDGPAALDPGGLIEGALHHQHEHIAVLLADRGFRLLPHARSIYRERFQKALRERTGVEPAAGGKAEWAPRFQSITIGSACLNSLVRCEQ
jgi:hypothetical protein